MILCAFLSCKTGLLVSSYFHFCRLISPWPCNGCFFNRCGFSPGTCNRSSCSAYPVIIHSNWMTGPYRYWSRTVWGVYPMCPANPVCMYYHKTSMVMNPAWMPYMPMKRSPGPPPAWIVPPAPGGYPWPVIWSIYKSYWRPKPDIYNNSRQIGTLITCIRTTNIAIIAPIDIGSIITTSVRFNYYLLSIYFFISNNLQYCGSVTGFLKLYHSNILAFFFRNRHL